MIGKGKRVCLGASLFMVAPWAENANAHVDAPDVKEEVSVESQSTELPLAALDTTVTTEPSQNLLPTAANQAYPISGIQVNFAQIVASTRQTNPQVLEQVARIRASEFALRSAKAQWLPTISLRSGTRMSSSDSALVEAKMPIFTFGRQSARIKVAEAELTTEKRRLVQVETEVLDRLFRLATEITGYQNKLVAARGSFDEQYAILEKVKRRENAGYASESDVAFVASKVNQTASRIREFEVALDNLKVEFATLTQIEPSDTLALDIAQLDALARSVDEISVAKNNPDIQVQASKVDIARMELSEIRLSDRPSLDLTAGTYLAGGTGSNGTLGVEFNYNYGQLGRSQAAQANQQRSLVKASEAQLENLRREKLKDFHILVYRRNFILSSTLPLQQQIILGLEANISSFTRLYQAGRKSLFELLNTHRELSEARIQRADLESQLVELNVRIAALAGQISRYSEIADGK